MVLKLAFGLEVTVGAAVLVATLTLITHGSGVRDIITTDEDDLELERQLKILNKPAIKSIKTDGHIFDCVDIYNQPAFDHPLLQNHKLKMRPSFIPQGLIHEASLKDKGMENIGLKKGDCPKGTVPIRRTRKEDLIRARSLPKNRRPTNFHIKTEDKPGWHYAETTTVEGGHAKYFGAQAYLQLCLEQQSLSPTQLSNALLWVIHGTFSGLNAIYVGWTVNPSLYDDQFTHLHASWTADNYENTGCADILCPGFVQINKQLPLGIKIYPSDNSLFKFSVFQDKTSLDWWLMAGPNALIGYWPGKLFTNLTAYARQVGWGGQTYSPLEFVTKPFMGTGVPPWTPPLYSRACSFQKIQYINISGGEFVDPEEYLERIADVPWCYDVSGNATLDNFMEGYNFLYGGPGPDCGY